MIYTLADSDVSEAREYAHKAAQYTSNRHDFHEGSLDEKEENMFYGKLGEKAFRAFLNEIGMSYSEDETSYTEADNYDFELCIGGFMNENTYLTVDVKTRTKPWHKYNLEMVEQFMKNGKDIYVFTRMISEREFELLGWVKNEDFEYAAIINNGYLDNYAFEDSQLRSMDTFTDYMYEVSQW